MKNFEDYSQMFGILDVWDKKTFEVENEKYMLEMKNIFSQIGKLEQYYQMLQRNSRYFKKRIRDFYMKELEKDFILKPEHKLVMQNIYVHFNGENNQIGTEGLGYLYENYLQLIYGKNKYELSEKEQSEYAEKFDKLMDEMPFAIKKLSE